MHVVRTLKPNSDTDMQVNSSDVSADHQHYYYMLPINNLSCSLSIEQFLEGLNGAIYHTICSRNYL